MSSYRLPFFCFALLLSACSQKKPVQATKSKVTQAVPAEPFTRISRADSINWRTVEASVNTRFKDSVISALFPSSLMK